MRATSLLGIVVVIVVVGSVACKDKAPDVTATSEKPSASASSSSPSSSASSLASVAPKATPYFTALACDDGEIADMDPPEHGPPSLHGELSAPSSHALVRPLAFAVCNQFEQVTSCGAKLTPRPSGSLVAAIGIDADKAISVKVSSATITDADYLSCVERAIGKIGLADVPSGSATYTITVRRLRVVKTLDVGPTVTGKLPPDAVRRIVRANFPSFRACYEAGLKIDPSIAGTVSTKFVINETGGVEGVKAAGGSLTNASVVACIEGVFAKLAFPKPESGKVTVTYPIDFESETP